MVVPLEQLLQATGQDFTKTLLSEHSDRSVVGERGKKNSAQRSQLEFSSGKKSSMEARLLVDWSNHCFQTFTWRAERFARQ